MDDVYGDLENYNDVNAIDELRNENKKLKCQVEKYEADIKKLQQDYDKVQSDYDKLASNFSSLLKTARLEIERKTQLINNLNHEKDTMVLNCLKNSDKSLLNIRRNLLQNHKAQPTNIPKESDIKKTESDRDKDINQKPSETKVTASCFTEESDKLPPEKNSKNGESKENLRDKNSESKENTPNIKSKALSISNRRKSMPVLNQLPRFSSDEELDENDSVDESNKKDRPYEDNNRITFDRNNHKVSETSGIDDKYSSHHESSRETYCNSRLKISDLHQRLDTRTNRDKYESSRYRRNFSPEYRKLRDHPEDSYKRGVGRYRVLESPPKDRYYDHRRAREYERRPNGERRYENRSRSRHDNRAPKHKLPCSDEPSSKRVRNYYSNRQAERSLERRPRAINDEERFEKKPNRDTQNVEKRFKETRPIEERVEGKRSMEKQHTEEIVTEKRPVEERVKEEKRRPIEERVNEEKRVIERRPIEQKATEKRHIEEMVIENRPKFTQAAEDRVMNLVSANLHEDSCQSPDHVLVDTVQAPIEIKLTPSAKLEDPRLKSSKYIKTASNQIMTTVRTNIDLKQVDIPSWNIPRVPMPEALQRPPQDTVALVKELHQTSKELHQTPSELQETPKYMEKLRKHVYVDIENPVSNLSMSMESGEIPSDSEASAVNDNIGSFLNYCETKRHRQQQVGGSLHDSNLKRHEETEKNSFGGKINMNSENGKKADQNTAKIGSGNEEAHASLPSSYRIPKFNKSDNVASKSTEEAIRDVLRESSKISTTANDKSKEESHKSIENAERSLSTSKESLETSKPKIILKLSELKGYRKLSPREIVADDLELSDDTTDFIETKKRKSKHKTKTHSHAHKTKTKDIKKLEVIENSKILDGNALDSTKQKTKKKSDKSKRSKSKELFDKKAGETVDKNTKPNEKNELDTLDKNPEFSKNNELQTLDKNPKFSELFGDSISSLITPEDLGVNLQSDLQPVNSYIPIYEDAQDADDLNVKEITEVQTKPPKTVTENTSKNIIDRMSNEKYEKHSIESNVADRYTQKESEGSRTVVNHKSEKLADIKAIYENLYAGDDDTKDTEVVKTVVLATGSQPEDVQSAKDSVNDNIDDFNTLSVLPQGLPNLQSTPLHALATSTPYKPLAGFDEYKTPQKPLSVNNVVAEERNTGETSCNSSENARDKTDVSTDLRTSTVDNSSVSQTEDVPDVRIFVKRRKRTSKKSL